MSHVAEEWQFGSRHVFQAFMARPADRNQIVKSVGRHCRREQPDRYLVMDVELPSQRLLRNLAIAATEAVTFSRQRGLHLPVPTPVFRASSQNQAVPVIRNYRRPSVEARFAAEVEAQVPKGKPARDVNPVPALLAEDPDLLNFRRTPGIRETQMQLLRNDWNPASHVSVPKVKP